MNRLRLLGKEFQLLVRSRVAWLVVAGTIGMSALGVQAIENANQTAFRGIRRTAYTMSLGAAQYGAAAGALLVALLVLLRMSRDDRKRSLTLLEASSDYVSVMVSRILAALLLVTATSAAALIGAVLLHLGLSDAPLEWPPYLFSFGVLLWPTLVLSALMASGLYLLFRNLDIAIFGFAGLYWLGINSSNYLMQWVQTSVTAYSDFAGMDPVGRFMVYNRLFCGAAALAFLFLSLWMHQRLGFGLRRSIRANGRAGILPAVWAVMTGLAILFFLREPYTFAGDSVHADDLAWNQDIQLERLECQVQLHPRQRRMTGQVRYAFSKKTNAVEVVLITNMGMEIHSMQVNGKEASWSRIPGSDRVRVALPRLESVELECHYQGSVRTPSAGLFTGYISPRSVYLLENSHWLFEPLTATKERVAVQGAITAPAWLTVVTPGLTERIEENNETRTWHFAARAPHLQMGLFAAEYEVTRMRAGDLELEFYFSPRHRAYIEGAEIADHLARITGFFQETIGRPAFAGWPLKIVETSIHKPGGHSSLNVVTLAEYMLNRQDPRSDMDRLRLEMHDLRLFAHEIAHQWWGTAVDIIPEGLWSGEGLADYSAYTYARRHLAEGVSHSIRGGWHLTVKRQRETYWAKDPSVLEKMPPAKRRLLERKIQGVDLYNRLPLRLAEIEDTMGETEFTQRLAAIYASHRGGPLGFGQFLDQMTLSREEFVGE